MKSINIIGDTEKNLQIHQKIIPKVSEIVSVLNAHAPLSSGDFLDKPRRAPLMILTQYKGKNSFAAWTTHHRKLGDGSPKGTVTPWVETGCGGRARSSLRGRRGSRARSSSARGRSPRSPRAPAPGWRLGPSPRSSRRLNTFKRV